MTDLLATLLSTGDEADYAVALDLCEQECLVLDHVPLMQETWFHRKPQHRRRSWVQITTDEYAGHTMRSRLNHQVHESNSICSWPDWREKQDEFSSWR